MLQFPEINHAVRASTAEEAELYAKPYVNLIEAILTTFIRMSSHL